MRFPSGERDMWLGEPSSATDQSGLKLRLSKAITLPLSLFW